jgi:hypothetical protein
MSSDPEEPFVWLLYEEVSDRLGTSKVVAVFSTEQKAMNAGERIRTSRFYIKQMPIDPDAFDQG